MTGSARFDQIALHAKDGLRTTRSCPNLYPNNAESVVVQGLSYRKSRLRGFFGVDPKRPGLRGWQVRLLGPKLAIALSTNFPRPTGSDPEAGIDERRSVTRQMASIAPMCYICAYIETEES